MAGYTRQSSADIVTDADILAAPLNAEFNQVQSAFSTSGHTHDGTAGNGPKLSLTGAVSGVLPVANGGSGVSTLDALTTALALTTADITDLSANGASLITAANYAAMKVLLDLEIGTDVQAYNANLTTWQGKTVPSGTVLGTTDTQTLTNKRITPRVGSTTSSATPSIDTDSYDIYRITALAAAITSITFTGTPTHGQKLILEITGTATRALTPGSSVENSSIAFPSTTNGTNMLMIGLSYNSATSKWRTIAVA